MLLNYCLFTAFGSGSVPTYSCWFTRVDSDEEAEGGQVVIALYLYSRDRYSREQRRKRPAW